VALSKIPNYLQDLVTDSALDTSLDLSGKTVTLPAASSAMTLLFEDTDGLTGASEIELSLPDGDYNYYRIIFNGLYLSEAADLYWRVKNTSGTEQTGYARALLSGGVGYSASVGASNTGSDGRVNYAALSAYWQSFEADLYNARNPSVRTHMHFKLYGLNSSANINVHMGGSSRTDVEEASAILFRPQAGTISCTSYKLYGVK
jgi:hypothetical protein